MISVKRLGHATLTSPDIERQIAYYTDVVGLTLVERGKDRAYLASKLGLEAVALEPGKGNALSALSLQVAPGTDLGEVERGLAKDGVKSERASGIFARRRGGGGVHRPERHQDRDFLRLCLSPRTTAGPPASCR